MVSWAQSRWVPGVLAVCVIAAGCAQGASDDGTTADASDDVSPAPVEAGGKDAASKKDSSVPPGDAGVRDAAGADATMQGTDGGMDTGTPDDSAPPTDATPPPDTNVPVDSGPVASAPPPYDASGAITFVQSASALTASSATSLSAPFSSPTNAGDLLVIAVGWTDNTAAVTSVVDTAGNTYEIAIGPTTYGSDLTQAIYYAAGIKAAANNKITVTFDISANGADLRAAEYAGLNPTAPLDVSATASGSSTSANSGAVTTRTARELLIGAGMTSDTFSPTASAGFSLAHGGVTANGNIYEDEIVSATGSYSAGGTLSPSAEWVMQLATFR
jgi:hypothetical protein